MGVGSALGCGTPQLGLEQVWARKGARGVPSAAPARPLGEGRPEGRAAKMAALNNHGGARTQNGGRGAALEKNDWSVCGCPASRGQGSQWERPLRGGGGVCVCVCV